MAKQRRLFNKGIMVAEIEKNFNRLLNTISKQDSEIEELERRLKLSEENRVKLARAYCKKLGIIKSEKEIKEYFKNLNKDPLDEIFVDKVRKPKQSSPKEKKR